MSHPDPCGLGKGGQAGMSVGFQAPNSKEVARMVLADGNGSPVMGQH